MGVSLELLDDLSEVVETFLAIPARLEHTLEANTSVQLMLVLKAPVAARVPVLCKVLLPVLQKLHTILLNKDIG